MNPKFAPKTPEGRIDRLIEEVGEVAIESGKLLQLLGKARRFGMDSQHPDGGLTNRNAILAAFSTLKFEMEDLANAAYLVETDLLDQQSGQKARDALHDRS